VKSASIARIRSNSALPPMIVMRVRVEHGHRKRGQFAYDGTDPANPHSGIEQQGLLGPEDEIGDHFLELERLVDGEDAVADAIDLEPVVGDRDALEPPILLARQQVAPAGLAGTTCEDEKTNDSGRLHADPARGPTPRAAERSKSPILSISARAITHPRRGSRTASATSARGAP
jgi:hypothetical protein